MLATVAARVLGASVRTDQAPLAAVHADQISAESSSAASTLKSSAKPSSKSSPSYSSRALKSTSQAPAVGAQSAWPSPSPEPVNSPPISMPDIMEQVCEHACIVDAAFPCAVGVHWDNAEKLLECPAPWNAPMQGSPSATQVKGPSSLGVCGMGALRSSWSWSSWKGNRGWLAAAREMRKMNATSHTSPAFVFPEDGEVPTASGMPGGVPCRQASDLKETRGLLISTEFLQRHTQARCDAMCGLVRSNSHLRLFGALPDDASDLYSCRTTDGTPLWKCLLTGSEPKHLEDLWLGHYDWMDDDTFENVLETLLANPHTFVENLRFNDCESMTPRAVGIFTKYSRRRQAAGHKTSQFGTLSFSDQKVGDDGVKNVTAAIPLDIPWLSLSYMGLTPKGAQWLAAQWLPHLVRPQSLFLGKWNVSKFSDAGWTVRVPGKQAAEYESAALAVIEAALRHDSLETLSMDAVAHFSDEGAAQLKDMLLHKSGRNLKRVQLRGNAFSEKGARILAEAARPTTAIAVCTDADLKQAEPLPGEKAYTPRGPPPENEACPWYEAVYGMGSAWYGEGEH